MYKFEKSELLTKDDIKNLLENTEPTLRAEVVGNKLKSVINIFEGCTFKYNRDLVAYEDISHKTDDFLDYLISSLISQSKRALPEAESKIMTYENPKTFKNLAESATIQKYCKYVKIQLSEYEYKFSNPQINRVHFQNGYYDFTERKFKSRVRGKDYVNFFIPREYKPSKEESREFIMSKLSQIYPKQEDRDYILQQFAIAMTGQSTNQQKILFMLGRGSAGKSTFITMLKLAFVDYVFDLDRTTFTKGTPKNQLDKIMNTYLANKHIRISNVNEPEDAKLDETLFKDFIDGNIKTTSLFKDGQNSFKHMSKLCFTANTQPRIKMDSGVVRRIEAYQHNSKFTEVQNEVNVENYIFEKDENLLKTIEHNAEYLNAICDIIFEYASKYINRTCIYQQPECFRDAKQEIVSSNDVVKDFIDKFLIRTENEKDIVGKVEMHELFKTFKPKSLITEQQLRDDLTDKGFTYLWKPKKKGVQGVFNKCKINFECGKESSLSELELENTLEITKEELSKAKLENINLLKELEELRKQINKQTTPEVKEIVKPKPVVDETKNMFEDCDILNEILKADVLPSKKENKRGRKQKLSLVVDESNE